MKRFLVIVCVASTSIVFCLIVFRVATKKEPSPEPPTQQQVQQATQIADTFAKVKTRPFNLGDFSQAVSMRSGTNLNNLSENERKKLLACIDRFYACYSSGNFEAFKQFRLHPPYTVSEAVSVAIKKIAAQKGLSLKSDEDIVHIAWDNYNGANKIGEVDEESIVVSIDKRQDMGLALRQPSAGKFPGLGASCWEGAVVYQPSPVELLKKEGSLRFFTLEVFVRFSPHADGPATPLLLMGYWDPTQEDWMPYALCTVLNVGNYDTIF
jgi:hypothetical protein